MALYDFSCKNENCENKEKVITKNIPITEYSSDNLPECEKCSEKMQRIYTAFSHQTFSDGYKG